MNHGPHALADNLTNRPGTMIKAIVATLLSLGTALVTALMLVITDDESFADLTTADWLGVTLAVLAAATTAGIVVWRIPNAKSPNPTTSTPEIDHA